MVHDLSIRLSDTAYARLEAEAARSGPTVEAIAHQRLVGSRSPSQQPDLETILEYLHGSGFIAHVPTGESDSPDEEAEADRLARVFGGARPPRRWWLRTVGQ